MAVTRVDELEQEQRIQAQAICFLLGYVIQHEKVHRAGPGATKGKPMTTKTKKNAKKTTKRAITKTAKTGAPRIGKAKNAKRGAKK